MARSYVAKLQKDGALPNRDSVASSSTPDVPASGAHIDNENDDAQDTAPTNNDTNHGDPQDNKSGEQPSLDINEDEKEQALSEVEAKKKAMEKEDDLVITQYPPRHGACATIKGAKNTKVLTNFYKIDIDEKTTFYEYDILDLPVMQIKKKLKKLIDSLIECADILKSNKRTFATDYATTIISWKKLHSSEEGSIIGTYNVPDGKKDDGRTDTRTLRLRYLRTLDFSQIRSYVSGAMNNPHLWNSSIEVKALNILVSKSLDENEVIRLGANKFFVKRLEKRLSGSLLTMQGYFYTIKPLGGSILLNVNFGTSAFYSPQPVSEYLNDADTFRDYNSRLAALTALRVQVQYGRGKTAKDRAKNLADPEGRQKTIQGTSKDKKLKELTFKMKGPDGKEFNKNVVSYFKERYNHEYNKTTLNLPGINLGTARDPEWFAASDLLILPHQIYRRPVPDHLTDTMLKRAAMIPAECIPLIEQVFDFLKISVPDNTGEASFAECQAMKITPQMLEVDSTILRYPAIIYENNSTVNLYNEFIKRDNYGETPRWTLNKRNFLDVGPAQNVGVQVFLLAPPTTGTSDDQSASALRTAILNALKRYNIGRGPKKLLSFITIHTLEENSLRTALTEAKEHFSEGRKKLVILQLPNRDRYIYPIFKDLADREFGLQAICVTESKMFQWDEGNNRTIKNIEQYLGNVMMKANLKCEGINHSAGGAIIDGNTNYKTAMTDVIRETMVLGADVTHPSLNSVEGCPSIAAIVGSVDDYGGKFLGSMRLQDQEKKDREIIQDVRSMVIERLKAYWSFSIKPTFGTNPKERAKLPKKIIYYRDGVSEGQYGKVVRDEVSAIRQAFEQVKKEKKWRHDVRVTAIVVTKRHHTRLYPISEADMEGEGNHCKPGTVVDTTITTPYFKEFFLQSHSGLKGTTKPAHYFVVADDVNWDIADLASFTHLLSYTYVRATCGVSYAPPAYYADRLCERGRIYLRTFLNGDTKVRESLNAKKAAAEERYRKIREAIFKPAKEQALMDKKAWPRKSKDEEIMELVHKEHVMKLCRQEAMNEAKKVWENYTGTDKSRSNPWHKALDGTMFWM